MKEEFFVGEEEIIEVLKRIRQCDNSSFLKSESDSEQSKEFVKEAFTSIISANELTKVKIKIKTDLPWWISFRELSNELHLKQEAMLPLAYGEQADLLIYSFFGECLL